MWARAKAKIQQPTDDQPSREESHEFDISVILEAQKTDRLCQEKIAELQQRPDKCTYILDGGVLYKSVKRGMFTQKLLYVQNFNVDRRKPSGQVRTFWLSRTISLNGIIAIPLPNQTGQTTAEALYEDYIYIYGVPLRILSDQGTHLLNYLVVIISNLLHIIQQRMEPLKDLIPRSNGN